VLTDDPTTTTDISQESSRGDAGSHPTVVIGLDGTETSWHAFAWGVGEAERLQGRVVAVLVSSNSAVTTPVTIGSLAGINPCDYAEFERAAEQLALELSSRAVEEGRRSGVKVRFVHRWGDAADQLTKVAVACHADIIAVGRSTSLLHRLAGSIGRRLARHKEPIVVIVP
jgi:nucleotide-binding universal stress UspA family protein